MDVDRSGRARRTEPAVDPEARDSREPDYATAFAARVADADRQSAEQWARRILEDAPLVLKWFVFAGWKFVLRLRLAPAGVPGTVARWTITRTGPGSITLEVDSSLVAARKRLDVDADRLTLTTYVWYERQAGRVLWSAIAPIHHLIEALLLTLARSRPGPERRGKRR